MAKNSTYAKTSAKKQPVDHIKRNSKLTRSHRIEFLLNDKEQDALDVYCKRYGIESKAGFVRETVMRCVMEQFIDDYPTLFDKSDLDKLKV